MRKNLNLGLLGLGFCGVLCANPIVVEQDTRVNAIIALQQLNRIKVVEDRITQVFGDENTFSLETDEENGQIFIKPLHENPIFLTLVTENGESIDLNLTPTETAAQTLVLKTNPTFEKAARDTALPLHTPIVDLITAMYQGEELEGFTRFPMTKHEVTDSLTLELQEVYQGTTVSGEVWQVKNNGNKPKTLTEKAFLTEPSIAAISLKTLTLAPNQSTQLFKVKRDE